MQATESTKHLKNLRAELNTGRNIAQIYLVVYSLLLPEILKIIAQSNNDSAKFYPIVYMFSFIIFTINYIHFTTRIDLTDFKPFYANAVAIIVAMSFSISISTFLTLYLISISNPYMTNTKIALSFYLVETILLTIFMSGPLLIKTKEETTINEIADELLRLKKNKIKEIAGLSNLNGWSMVILFLFVYVESAINIIMNQTF